MNKTKIDWADYSINPVKGKCPMACSYCYARRMYDRFKWNPEIRMEPDWAEDLPKKPSRVFVGSTMELFGSWVEERMWDSIWQYVNSYPRHTFIFLTKQPQNLIKWSPFPDNCWVGWSTTGNDCRSGFEDISRSFEAKVKFVSIEPLLNYTPMDFRWVDWVIIGQQTPVKPATMPRIEWIRDIVEAADKAGVPVFLKENLENLFCYPLPEWAEDKFLCTRLRQEFPKV